MDNPLEPISTTVKVVERAVSGLDEIIQKINTRYELVGAKDAVESIVEDLVKDDRLVMNVRHGARSAYEAETLDRLNAICVNGMLMSEGDWERFYAELSKDRDFLRQLAVEVIRRIQEGKPAV